MTQDGLKAIADILQFMIVPIIAFAGGFFAKWFLQSRKSRDELLQALAPQRAEVFIALWKLTTSFRGNPKEQLTPSRRAEVNGEFREWYYNKAGALFLSWRASKQYLIAVDRLRDPQADEKALEKEFSLLRTALKRDSGIYTWWNGCRQLPPPRASPEVEPPPPRNRRKGAR